MISYYLMCRCLVFSGSPLQYPPPPNTSPPHVPVIRAFFPAAWNIIPNSVVSCAPNHPFGQRRHCRFLRYQSPCSFSTQRPPFCATPSWNHILRLVLQCGTKPNRFSCRCLCYAPRKGRGSRRAKCPSTFSPPNPSNGGLIQRKFNERRSKPRSLRSEQMKASR